MLNNFEQIKGLMDFSLEGTYYFIQCLRRSKDQPEDDSQTSNNIVIKDYYIKSFDYFDKVFPEIQTMCDVFNARAYIRLNRCFWQAAAFETLKSIAEYMGQGNFSNVKAAFSTASGRRCYDPEKKWIIDIDTKEDIDYSLEEMEKAMPVGNKLLAKIPTPNGYHMIVKPFDKRAWERKYGFDIHKNNPTILYTP